MCFRAHDILIAHFPNESPPRKEKQSINIQYTVKLRFSVDFSIVYWGLWWACWEYGGSLRFLYGGADDAKEQGEQA